MRAAMLFGPNDVRIEEVPAPAPAPGEVLLRVRHNGICGSDLHLVHAPFERAAPIGLGHEFAGTIEQLGDGVTGLAPGDHVCVQPNISCGTCPRCRAGLTHLCETVAFIGTGTANGGLAEWISVPAPMVFPLPDGMTLERGALIEPMSVAYHAVTSTGIEPGQSALVMGAGPIGIGTVLTLRALGVEDILVAETAPARRRVMAALGADVVDPAEVDVVAEAKRRTAGAGVAAAFDCAGVTPAFDAAVSSTRAQGTVCVVALHLRPTKLDLYGLLANERRITGTLGYRPGVFPQVIELMAGGAYPPEGWVEHIPLDALVDEGLRPLEHGTKLKVLVDL